jgi:hypothetical protein
VCNAHRVVIPIVFVFGRSTIQDARLSVRYRAIVRECLRDERRCFAQAVEVVVDFGSRFVAYIKRPLQTVLIVHAHLGNSYGKHVPLSSLYRDSARARDPAHVPVRVPWLSPSFGPRTVT